MDINDKTEFDVVVIGGGATGAGTARDCAMRGMRVLVVERHDFATGATGRNHGLLHSGSRYAVTDAESASECIKENMILRRIAKHCVEENDGLFITLPEDDLEYQAKFVASCTAAGIRADVLDPKEAIALEPAVNPAIIGAVRVPDGSVDPFRLTMANITDAKLNGAQVLTQAEVVGFIFDQNKITGVTLRDNKTGQKKNVRSKLVINAAGIWGQRVANLAGVSINMFPAKGALLVYGHRVNNMVINRCRKPANADILVPGDLICVIGTTSTRVPFEECDDMRVTREEAELLMAEGEKLAPSLATTRILRAYAGVRPLVASDADPSGRSISRGIVLLDHETRDGLAGLITITGGKLMTYRLMAEWATDLACKKLGIDAVCLTANVALPGTRKTEAPAAKVYQIGGMGQKAATSRHGTDTRLIKAEDDTGRALVCECEGVTVAEADFAINSLHADRLVDLRRRTRTGMGTCQGELCACRAAGRIANATRCAEKAEADLKDFIAERWKGMYPVAWGETLSQAQFTSWIYEGVYGLGITSNA